MWKHFLHLSLTLSDRELFRAAVLATSFPFKLSSSDSVTSWSPQLRLQTHPVKNWRVSACPQIQRPSTTQPCGGDKNNFWLSHGRIGGFHPALNYFQRPLTTQPCCGDKNNFLQLSCCVIKQAWLERLQTSSFDVDYFISKWTKCEEVVFLYTWHNFSSWLSNFFHIKGKPDCKLYYWLRNVVFRSPLAGQDKAFGV